MAVTCKNCGGTLIFDPEKQKMICDRCGSAITPGEVDFYAREILENKKPVPLSDESEPEPDLDIYPGNESDSNDDTEYEWFDPPPLLKEDSKNTRTSKAKNDSDYEWCDPPPLLKNEEVRSIKKISLGNDPDDFMDCSVYTCDYCGGEVIVNGTEASTMCIFCGNPTIVFSRVTKQRRPDMIVPFKITKKDALKSIRKHFKKGFFIPGEIKHFKEQEVRGIYIPYWIADAEHYGTVVIEGSVEKNKNNKDSIYYYGRSGMITINDFPVDASRLLPYDISSRLEPYGIRNAEEFHEDYLAGFYSSIADDKFDDLSGLIEKRAAAIFEETAMGDLMDAAPERIVEAAHYTEIDYSSLRYAMLPAWFVIYNHKGKHNTILVNGETGKVVCGVPWNKVLFFVLFTLFALAMTAAGVLLMYMLLEVSAEDHRFWEALLTEVMIVYFLFKLGINHFKKISKSLGLTQSTSVFNFVKRRQG